MQYQISFNRLTIPEKALTRYLPGQRLFFSLFFMLFYSLLCIIYFCLFRLPATSSTAITSAAAASPPTDVYKRQSDGSAETYLTPARIYFEVDKQGVVRMAVGQNLTDWSNGVLTVKAEKQTQAQVNVVLADADGNALVNAGTSIFVLKDENGAVIYNSNTKASEENESTEAKYPLYYISGTGSQLKLSGIPAGSYYLSEVKAPDGYELADDQKFMLKDGGAEQKLTMKHKKKEGTAKVVNVAVQATFTKTLLTAENDIVNYVALYSDSDLSQRVTEPRAVTFKAGDTTSSNAEFTALTDGTTYYIGLTDAFGEKAGTDYELSDNVVAAKAAEDEQAVLDIDYTTYPDGDYSYQADISVTVQVKDVQGAAYAASDPFYAMLYHCLLYTSRCV